MSAQMDHMNLDPKPKKEDVHGSKVMDEQGTPVDGGAAGGGLHDHHDADAMDIDSRGNAHGQTQEQIHRQSQKVQDKINETYQKLRSGAR